MTEWYQQALTPATVYQVNIRVGVIPSEDHVQVLAEMIDPVTGIQIAQASIPHKAFVDLDVVLVWAVGRARDWIEEAVDPF